MTRAVRRDWTLVVAIVLLVTGVVVLVSALSPPRYRANARIADEPLAADTADATASDRRLATSRELVTTPAVLGAAAREVSGETADTLADKVTATVDPAASILDVAVTDRDPRHAAEIANAVARTFLDERDRIATLALSQAQERVAKELEDQRRRGATGATLDALRANLGDLAASEVMVASGLRLAQPATPPSQPYAPRPVRSALVAFLAALLVAVLVAVARDRLRRRVPGPDALSAGAELPLIAALPATELGWRRRRDPTLVDAVVIEEAALQAAVRVALPPRTQRVVLVHGTRPDDGAARVAAALARSLSWAGHAAVLVGIDARGVRPAVLAPGPDVPVVRCTDVDGQLAELQNSEYRYVIVPTPRGARGPALRELATHAAGVILVARLGATSVDDVVAGRRLLNALGLHGLGLVVTYEPKDAPELARTGFGAPLRPRGRSRGTAQNGAHGYVEPSAPAATSADAQQ